MTTATRSPRTSDLVALALATVLLAAFGCGPGAGAACDDADAGVCPTDDACLGRAHVIPTGLAALHFVAADLDGDDVVDVLAVGTREDGSVAAELHRGHGDGTFAEPVSSAATGCSAYPLAGDFDGDAIADLAYPDCDGALLLFWGAATGPGAASSTIALPFVMTGSTVADMDADGTSDLVVVGRDTSDVARLGWVRGESSRALALVTSIELGGLPFVPTAVRSGDANGDGTPDAFTYAHGVSDGLAVAAGRPDGGFAAAEPTLLGARIGQVTTGSFASATAATDVLVTAPDDMRLLVAEIGADTPAVATTAVFPYRPTLATAVEWDDEPGDEALVADGFADEVRLFRFAGDGTASEEARVRTPHAAQLVLVPDLDGDGTPDLLVGHFAAAAFSVRLSSESPQ